MASKRIKFTKSIQSRSSESTRCKYVEKAIAFDVHKKIENIKVDQRTYVDKAFERLNVMKPLIFSLGGIALFVVALLIMGSFFLSVRSRFKQWALLRALGSNPNQIILVVLLEALCIGAIGSLAGVILGAGTQTIAASFINKWVNIEGAGKEAFSISGEIFTHYVFTRDCYVYHRGHYTSLHG